MARAADVNRANSDWLSERVGGLRDHAYRVREVRVKAPLLGEQVGFQFPGKESARPPPETRPHDARPVPDGQEGRLLANHEVWQGVEAKIGAESAALPLLAGLLARSAFCMDHRLGGPATWEAETVEWKGGGYHAVGTLQVPGMPYVWTPPESAVAGLEAMVPELCGMATRTALAHVELIAVQEESKYSWARRHLNQFTNRPEVGRRNFLLSIVKGIGVVRGLCAMTDDQWHQRGPGRVAVPASLEEIRQVTGGLLTIHPT